MHIETSMFKRFWLNCNMFITEAIITVGSAPVYLIKPRKLTRFWSITIFCMSILISISIISIPGWLFWQLFFNHLQYWHMLIFGIFVCAFLSWYSFAKSLRERYLALRIIEQLIVLGFITIVILFLSRVT